MDTQSAPETPQPPQSPAPAAATNWRLYMELLTFTAFVFPFGQIVGPLVLWLMKKDSEPEVLAEGKRVLNFNISWLLWSIVTCGLGVIVWVVIAIIATLKAANREPFQHPLTIQFLK